MVLAKRVVASQPKDSLLINAQHIFYKELKVDMRSTPCLQSHTPLTAMQEIAALILAYAVLVDYRIEAAKVVKRSVPQNRIFAIFLRLA